MSANTTIPEPYQPLSPGKLRGGVAFFGIVVFGPLWTWAAVAASWDKLARYLPNADLERGLMTVSVCATALAVYGVVAGLMAWREGRKQTEPRTRLIDNLVGSYMLVAMAAFALFIAVLIPVLRHHSSEIRVAALWAFWQPAGIPIIMAGSCQTWWRYLQGRERVRAPRQANAPTA